MREGDGAQQPPRQLCSAQISSPEGGKGGWYLLSPRLCRSQVGSLPATRLPAIGQSRPHTLRSHPCQQAVPVPPGPMPGSLSPRTPAQGSILKGRTGAAFIPPSLVPGCQPGRAQSKTSDTIDFAPPVLHTYLYSHHSVPLTPHLLGISRKTQSS